MSNYTQDVTHPVIARVCERAIVACTSFVLSLVQHVLVLLPAMRHCLDTIVNHSLSASLPVCPAVVIALDDNKEIGRRVHLGRCASVPRCHHCTRRQQTDRPPSAPWTATAMQNMLDMKQTMLCNGS